MKKIFTLLLITFTTLSSFSQKINGQWRGYFDSNGDIVLNGSNSTEYVLELEIDGTEVTGFSYSYFQNRRYYVICKLQGTYNKSSKSIKVTETERTKGNTPPDFADCLQTHFLTYQKQGETEELVGKWETAPGQRSSCGVGTTALKRRTLSKDLSSFNAAVKNQPSATPKDKKLAAPPLAKKTEKNTPVNKLIPPAKQTKPVAKNSVKKITVDKATPPVAKTNIIKKTIPLQKKETVFLAPVHPLVKDSVKQVKPPSLNKIDNNALMADIGYEKRKTDILKSIEIEHETFTVTFYDNGEVDGDSISVFYNGKLILAHQRLSEKPLSLTLDANSGKAVNELTMYAENLGEIAPNTALMVVLDGEKRYEVRISSDLKNSGTIHFIHQQKTQ